MGLFDDLKNVTAREETPTPKSDLERVLDVEKIILEKYKNIQRIFKTYVEDKTVLRLYQRIYNRIEQELSNGVINEKILQEYIDARENSRTLENPIIRGYFSAVLLEIANQTSPYITIDGRNRRWDYLFSPVRNVKNLYIKNVVGEFILYRAGSQGNIENVFAKNIQGNHSLSSIGKCGQAKNIIVTQAGYGERVLFQAGRGGDIQNLILTDSKIDESCGVLCGYGGIGSNVLLHNVSGEGTLGFAGKEGKIKNICLSTTADSKLFLQNFGELDNLISDRTIPYFQGRNKPFRLFSVHTKETVEKILERIKQLPELMGEKRAEMHREIAELQKELYT